MTSTAFKCGADKLTVGNSGTTDKGHCNCLECLDALKEYRCPACNGPLSTGPHRTYEALWEHVSDPNREPPSRATLVCLNHYCTCFQNVFWAYDGEGPFLLGHVEYDWINKNNWIDGNPCPFGSHHRGSHFRIYYNKEDKSISAFGLTVKRKIRYMSNDTGDKVGRYSEHSFIFRNRYWNPWPKQLVSYLCTFHREYKHSKFPEETYAAFTNPKYPVKTRWMRFAKALIRIFYRG